METMIPKDSLEVARQAVAALEAAGDARAAAVARVMELEDQRPLVKSRCIAAMIGTENPETKKPHSASSAEKIVESHPEYSAHRELQRTAEVAKLRAYAAYDAARFRARLAIAAAFGEDEEE